MSRQSKKTKKQTFHQYLLDGLVKGKTGKVRFLCYCTKYKCLGKAGLGKAVVGRTWSDHHYGALPKKEDLASRIDQNQEKLSKADLKYIYSYQPPTRAPTKAEKKEEVDLITPESTPESTPPSSPLQKMQITPTTTPPRRPRPPTDQVDLTRTPPQARPSAPQSPMDESKSPPAPYAAPLPHPIPPSPTPSEYKFREEYEEEAINNTIGNYSETDLRELQVNQLLKKALVVAEEYRASRYGSEISEEELILGIMAVTESFEK